MRILFLLLAATFTYADSIDRLALVVGKTAFTQSEVEQEVRLNELETGKPLDLSPARRKEAAERLIDQQLLRDEIALIGFEAPTIQTSVLYSQFCQQHFGATSQCRAALERYGVSQTDLEQHLAWEVTALKFTDQRFAPIAASDGQTTDGHAADGDKVDQQMEAWLKERRAATRIVYKQEAFQ